MLFFYIYISPLIIMYLLHVKFVFSLLQAGCSFKPFLHGFQNNFVQDKMKTEPEILIAC